MFIRFITSAVGLPLAMVLIYYGGIALKLASLFVILLSLYEFYTTASKKFKPIAPVGYIMTTFYILFIEVFSVNTNINMLISFGCVAAFSTLVIFNQKYKPVDVFVTLFGFLYIVIALSYVYLLKESSRDAVHYVMLIFICAWGTDTGAYFVGTFMGKHKLIPSLSPKKTIEGSVGGIIFTMIFAFVYGYVVQNYFFGNKNYSVIFIIIAFFGSIVSQFGDLAASSMKRYFDVKDFGKFLPGHGGMIDRFDSVIFTAPLVYFIYNFVNNFELFLIEYSNM